MSGQDGIDSIRAKQGAGDKSLDPDYHADALQQVFNDALKPWRRVIDSDTIGASDRRLDVFPDEGAQANVVLTLLAPTGYADGWSCDIYNDTATNYVVTVNLSGGASLVTLPPATGYSVVKNGAGFDLVQIKGREPSQLDVTQFGDFNAVINATKPSGLYFIAGNGSQFSNYPPQWKLQPTTPYVFVKETINTPNAYTEQIYFYSTFDVSNERAGQRLSRFGGNFGGAVAGGWRPNFSPDSFAVSSSSVIAVGTEAAPSIFTGLTVVQPILGFDVDATLGAVKNISGTDIGRCAGSMAVQPVKSGGGGTAVISIYSEISADGVAWTVNPNSLRTFEVPNDGESFLTAPSFISNWPNGHYVRFRIATNGGTISLEPPSKTLNGTTITGLSAYWSMTRIG